MNTPSESIRRAVVIACFACGLAWWLAFRLITGITLEDALITYRYAQHLALGQGFVFNSGEKVLGTTTPLLALFLGLLGRLLGPATIPLVATLAMTCFGILAGIVVYHILKELGYSFLTCNLSIFLFFGNVRILVPSIGGMETPLVLFLMAAGALALMRGRPMASLLLSAFLVLARPDGAIWAAMIAVAVVFQCKRIPWKAVLVAVCVVTPWLVFSVWYFGSPLPNTIAAKQAVSRFSDLPPFLSLASLKVFAGWFIRSSGFALPSPIIPLWLIAVVLGMRSYLSQRKRRGLGVIFIVFLTVYGLFLYAGRAPHFEWYLTPASLCAVLLIAPGIVELAATISGRLQGVFPGLRIGPAIAVAFVACVCVLQNRGMVRHHFEYQANEIHTRAAIGIWLKKNTAPESIIAMEAIGYQGFFSERRVIDLAGLVSPRVLALRKASSSNAELFFRVLNTLKPDYIVLRSFEVDENVCFFGGKLFETREQREYFDSRYREGRRFSAPFPERWGRKSFLTIYACRSEPCRAASNGLAAENGSRKGGMSGSTGSSPHS